MFYLFITVIRNVFRLHNSNFNENVMSIKINKFGKKKTYLINFLSPRYNVSIGRQCHSYWFKKKNSI